MNKHGGSRIGAGRKARTEPKAGLIWCGQISQEDRAFIIQHLSPNDRYQVLMAAANTACSGRVVLSPPQALSTPKKLSARKALSKPSTRR